MTPCSATIFGCTATNAANSTLVRLQVLFVGLSSAWKCLTMKDRRDRELGNTSTTSVVTITGRRVVKKAVGKVPVCFRCLSFDHVVKDCRLTVVVCRHCGGTGHKSNMCANGTKCRSYALRERPAGNLILAAARTAYGAMVAMGFTNF
uniref:CCHC-type domain-containing protein n=1 Tax=Glossina pallidipes TaxID=7398 RepID=A0A1B0A9S0_GLOPL